MTQDNAHIPTVSALDAALAEYKARPTAEHLLTLHQAALPLLVGSLPVANWRPVEDTDAFVSDFESIRVMAGRVLSAEEVRRLSGCLGYALRQTLCGEDLSDPTITNWRGSDGGGATYLEYYYDSTKSCRDDPDFEQAFALAKEYIHDGSPLRRTNRAGWGTKGTRLVEGVGECPVAFFVH